jgi:hypothetical protein
MTTLRCSVGIGHGHIRRSIYACFAERNTPRFSKGRYIRFPFLS